ncbi:hypothetical protein [Mucilaginibacter psychrotolerans]|uniref:Gliding motility-associated protein GldM N-terminal domain-containing protein n=1 Tax=Mucilaginibacter psychrotolerans TaxID=1524096 RepID=A0A4Y8SNS2_9SPHI|nr:hypothetical protein [Mucilaginibacter psychrotolerans]TFF40729.1 hypothetical protein E2R66_00705 [Mucilaginibacter psychrotolerans]
MKRKAVWILLILLAATFLIAYPWVSIPTNLLNSFDVITKSLDASQKGLDSSINVSYQALKNNPQNRDPEKAANLLSRAKQATAAVDKLVEHIDLIRRALRENILTNSDTSENLSYSGYLMIRSGEATVLKTEIDETRKTLISLLGANAKNTTILLDTKAPKPVNSDAPQSWQVSYFGEGIPAQAVITTLAKIEVDARESEYKVINKILSEGDR